MSRYIFVFVGVYLFDCAFFHDVSGPWRTFNHILPSLTQCQMLLARDAQAKLALIVAQCLSICLSVTAWVTRMCAALLVASHIDYRLVTFISYCAHTAEQSADCVIHPQLTHSFNKHFKTVHVHTYKDLQNKCVPWVSKAKIAHNCPLYIQSNYPKLTRIGHFHIKWHSAGFRLGCACVHLSVDSHITDPSRSTLQFKYKVGWCIPVNAAVPILSFPSIRLCQSPHEIRLQKN